MKRLVLIVMCLMCIAAWIMYFVNKKTSISTYQINVDKAQEYLEKEIYVEAVECLKKVVELRPEDINNKILLAKTYRKMGMNTVYERYCLELYRLYPSNIDIICMVGDFYCESNHMEKALSWYKKIDDSLKTNEIIAERIENIKYTFRLEYANFDDIFQFYNGYGVYKLGDKYGLIDQLGNEILDAEYDYVGAVSNMNDLLIVPVKKDGMYFFVDLDGNKRLVPDYNCQYLGSFSENGLIVVKKDNNYYYCNRDFEIKSKEYEQATSFVGKYAIVKENNKWRVIDENFNYIGNSYEDVKIDYYNVAIHKDMIVARKNNKYIIVNTEGQQLGEFSFDDLDYILSDELIAYKNNGKWGYVDLKGNIAINEKFQEAGSFSCGMAPVKINDKWGYINTEGKVVVEPVYAMATALNENGVAQVYDFSWKLLRLNAYLEE